jgi:hypothetical protein
MVHENIALQIRLVFRGVEGNLEEMGRKLGGPKVLAEKLRHFLDDEQRKKEKKNENPFAPFVFSRASFLFFLFQKKKKKKKKSEKY